MHVTQQCSRTVLAPVVSVGIDLLAQDLDVFASGATVELIAARLLAAQLVRVFRVVLNDEPEVRRRLLRLLKEEEQILREYSETKAGS